MRTKCYFSCFYVFNMCFVWLLDCQSQITINKNQFERHKSHFLILLWIIIVNYKLNKATLWILFPFLTTFAVSALMSSSCFRLFALSISSASFLRRHSSSISQRDCILASHRCRDNSSSRRSWAVIICQRVACRSCMCSLVFSLSEIVQILNCYNKQQ